MCRPALMLRLSDLLLSSRSSRPMLRAQRRVRCRYHILLTSVSEHQHFAESTVSALFLMAYCAGNLSEQQAHAMLRATLLRLFAVGPQTFRGKDAPTYTPALIIIVACLVASFGILAAILAMNTARNKRQIAICQSLDYVSNPDQAFMDLTDLQNPEFRYRL